MALDWTPLNTPEKLIAYLEEINLRRAAAPARDHKTLVTGSVHGPTAWWGGADYRRALLA
jgi:hypothetical protein